MATGEELRAFMRRRQMVRFERRFCPGHTTGYVVGVGVDLFLMVHIDDSIRFDGFQVHRNRDVRKLQTEPYAKFQETALKRRRARRPVKPRIRLHDFRQLIRTAGRSFPLLAIHRERVDPDICQIGAVTHVGEHRVTLREITPDGTWLDELHDYALREITRVDFGDSYADALYVVGGRPPLAKSVQ